MLLFFFDCWYKYSEYNLNTKACVYYFVLFFVICFDLQHFAICNAECQNVKYLTFYVA